MKIGNLILSSHGFKIRKFKVILNDEDVFVMNVFGAGIIYNRTKRHNGGTTTMSNVITGIGFFATIAGLAGLAEGIQGNGDTTVGIAFVAVGIIIMATQTISRMIRDH